MNEKITKKEIKKEFNSETIFYHGNENKEHYFSEIRPSFFSTDKEYSSGYGKYVYSYNLEIKKPFDPATDEIARTYYNENFLQSELAEDARPLELGEHIHINHADNFWAYISSEEEMGNGLGYDSIIVNEGSSLINEYKTNLSIVPLSVKQIKPLKAICKKRKYNIF